MRLTADIVLAVPYNNIWVTENKKKNLKKKKLLTYASFYRIFKIMYFFIICKFDKLLARDRIWVKINFEIYNKLIEAYKQTC